MGLSLELHPQWPQTDRARLTVPSWPSGRRWYEQEFKVARVQGVKAAAPQSREEAEGGSVDGGSLFFAAAPGYPRLS